MCCVATVPTHVLAQSQLAFKHLVARPSRQSENTLCLLHPPTTAAMMVLS